MKVLVLGGEGMIGRGLVKGLSQDFEIAYTNYKKSNNIINNIKVYEDVNGFNLNSITRVLNEFKPKIVINAIGIVKQKVQKGQDAEIIKLNSVLPYELQALCELQNSKLVLLSTDCVFSGRDGNYKESDLPDAYDLYGRTKIIGEISNYTNVLTVRISSIGLEMNTQKGLIEWFLSQSGEIYGFEKAIYSGFTTMELSRIFKLIFTKYTNLNGLYHISSSPISKFELLNKLKNIINKDDVAIKKNTTFICDRSLNSEKFKSETKYETPTWDNMLQELGEDILKRKSDGSIQG